MDYKFNIGDEVKVIKGVEKGHRGTITGYNLALFNRCPMYKVFFKEWNGHRLWKYEKRLIFAQTKRERIISEKYNV